MRLALAQNSYEAIPQQEFNKVLENRAFKVAILVRVSTPKEEQKSSLENQRKLFMQMCSENGWEIYDFYEEIESGTHTNRKGLNQLINDAKKHKFELILAKELSRLARNVPLAYQLKELLNKYKIHLKTLDGAIDTLNDDQDKFGLYAWIYEQESQKTSNRIKRTFRTKAKEGEFNGSNPPYGYYVENKKLYIKDDETPEIVRRIYKEYIQGKGFDGIARGLYNDGIPTPSQVCDKANGSDKWHGSTVKNILMNPHYTGSLVQCRDAKPTVTDSRQLLPMGEFVIVENVHEAIISLDTFNTVQDLIIARRRIRPQQENHLFTNTVFCANCGRGMHFKQNRKGYVCGNFNKHGIKACSDHFIKEALLTKIILGDIKSITSKLNLDSTVESLTKNVSMVDSNIKKRLKKVEKSIENLNTQKVQITKLLAKENITIEDYRLTIEDINNSLNNLASEKYKLESSKLKTISAEEIAKLKKELNYFLQFEKLTPEMLHSLVERIEIKEDGSPKIVYRFSEELMAN